MRRALTVIVAIALASSASAPARAQLQATLTLESTAMLKAEPISGLLRISNDTDEPVTMRAPLEPLYGMAGYEVIDSQGATRKIGLFNMPICTAPRSLTWAPDEVKYLPVFLLRDQDGAFVCDRQGRYRVRWVMHDPGLVDREGRGRGGSLESNEVMIEVREAGKGYDDYAAMIPWESYGIEPLDYMVSAPETWSLGDYVNAARTVLAYTLGGPRTADIVLGCGSGDRQAARAVVRDVQEGYRQACLVGRGVAFRLFVLERVGRCLGGDLLPAGQNPAADIRAIAHSMITG